MSDTETFAAYAAAFEEAFSTDEWEGVASFFSDDAVYEASGCALFDGSWRGRDVIVTQLKASVDGFDRRFEAREPELLGLDESDGCVLLRYAVTYRCADGPALRFEADERIWIEDGKIVRIVDAFDRETGARITAFAAKHLAT